MSLHRFPGDSEPEEFGRTSSESVTIATGISGVKKLTMKDGAKITAKAEVSGNNSAGKVEALGAKNVKLLNMEDESKIEAVASAPGGGFSGHCKAEGVADVEEVVMSKNAEVLAQVRRVEETNSQTEGTTSERRMELQPQIETHRDSGEGDENDPDLR